MIRLRSISAAVGRPDGGTSIRDCTATGESSRSNGLCFICFLALIRVISDSIQRVSRPRPRHPLRLRQQLPRLRRRPPEATRRFGSRKGRHGNCWRCSRCGQARGQNDDGAGNRMRRLLDQLNSGQLGRAEPPLNPIDLCSERRAPFKLVRRHENDRRGMAGLLTAGSQSMVVPDVVLHVCSRFR